MKIFRLLSLLLLFLFALPAMAQAPAPAPAGSGAPVRAESVNEEALFKQDRRIDGRISIPDESARFLIQPQGRDWRQFHEVYLPWIAGTAIILMLIALIVFYMLVGPTRANYQPTGRRIIRFPPMERFTHWMVAISFIVLALTGLNYVFGKRLIMPLMSPLAFGEFSQWMKYAHNFFAWPFTLGILLMIVFWTRDNLPRRGDLAWIKAGGGLTGRTHVHAARFNAGQKLMFWSVVILGLAMFGTGLVLLFPLMWVDVNGMQLTNVVHSTIGALFTAGILAHIYIGTIGMQGAFEAMGNGTVDLGWARQHHDLWADEVAGRPAAARDDVPAAGIRQQRI